MKTLRIGVIGLGVIGNVHLDVIEKSEETIVAVCDTNNATLTNITEKYDVKGYDNYKKMITNEQLDVVHICTPHFLHKEMILTAAKHGIHVVCEKPVVMNLQEAEEAGKALEHSTAKVGVVFQNRYNPTIQKVWEYIKNQELGQLKAITSRVYWQREAPYYTESDWRGRYKTEGGGVLINQAIHTLDLMQWMGGAIDRVDGTYKTHVLKDVIEVEDTAEAMIHYANGVKGFFYATNGYINNRPVEMEWEFEKGTLRLLNQVLYLQKDEQLEMVERDMKTDKVKGYYGNSHQTAISAFYHSVINNTNDYITVKEASKVLEVIHALRVSHDKNIGERTRLQQ